MRSSFSASAWHTSCESSVEALSEMTSSMSAWSWARTDSTTPTTDSPALRSGSPIETSVSGCDINAPSPHGWHPIGPAHRLRPGQVEAAQQGEQDQRDRGAAEHG